jgi:hypothetical protein
MPKSFFIQVNPLLWIELSLWRPLYRVVRNKAALAWRAKSGFWCGDDGNLALKLAERVIDPTTVGCRPPTAGRAD